MMAERFAMLFPLGLGDLSVLPGLTPDGADGIPARETPGIAARWWCVLTRRIAIDLSGPLTETPCPR